MRDVKSKYVSAQARELDKVGQYVKNFSEIADMVDMKKNSNEQPVMHHFTQALKEKVQINAFKLAFAKTL